MVAVQFGAGAVGSLTSAADNQKGNLLLLRKQMLANALPEGGENND